jgi:superfamily II DNA/RNA helicase
MKTLAFILPLLQRLKQDKIVAGRGEMSVLIIEPTRELARQVEGEIKKLSRDVRVVTVYGGVGYGDQQDKLRAGVDICVGTPGRLLDLLERGACTTRRTVVVVLDEADEMLQRGFKREIDQILGMVNKGKKAQMLLFSATLPDWVRQVSSTFQKDSVIVDKVTGEDNATPQLIDHIALPCPRMLIDRVKLIGQLARSVEGRVILFVSTKLDAEFFTSRESAMDMGVKCQPLHGDCSQARRDAVTAEFKQGRIKLLVSDHTTHTHSHTPIEGGGCDEEICHARQVRLRWISEPMNTAQHCCDHSSHGH